MIYNKRVEEFLSAHSNEEYRKSSSVNYIFDSQIETAKEVLLNFTSSKGGKSEYETNNRHIILYAQMQSGKTGICSAIINILKTTTLENYFGIKQYMFITGMNDKGLQKQSKDRLIDQVFDMTASTVNDEIKYEHPYYSIYVYKNSELRFSNLILKDTLILIDESHYGTDQARNILNQFLDKSKIDWKNEGSLKINNNYLVSISATPFNEMYSDIADTKPKVFLTVSESYYGIKEFDSLGLLKSANNTEKEMESVIDDAYIRMKQNKINGAVFVRTRKLLKNVSSCWDILYLDSNNEPISYLYVNSKIENLIYSPNSKPLLIIIKGAYRAGITIESKHKDYIYAIYDISNKREATLQGLIGRMCGYRSNENLVSNTLFYVNKNHCEDYIQFINGVKEYERAGKGDPSRLFFKEDIVIPIDFKLVYDKENKIIIDKNFLNDFIKKTDLEFDPETVLEYNISGRNSYSEGMLRRKFDGKTLSFNKKIKVYEENKDNIGKRLCSIILNDLESNPSIIVRYGEIKENVKTVSIGKLTEIKKNNLTFKQHKN
jgi:hypothetical protein